MAARSAVQGWCIGERCIGLLRLALGLLCTMSASKSQWVGSSPLLMMRTTSNFLGSPAVNFLTRTRWAM